MLLPLLRRGRGHALGLSAVVFLALILLTPAGARAEAAADSVATALRGTAAPLPGTSNPLRHLGRGLLFVPYAAVEVAVWPIERLAELDEAWHLQARLGRAGAWAHRITGFDVSPILSFESSTGLSVAGFELEGEDKVLEGDEMEIELGYFTERKNIASFFYLSPERPLQLRLQAFVENEEDRPFFGLGPNSADHLYAANRRRELVESSLLLRPLPWAHLCATGYWRDTELRDPSDEDSAREAYPDVFAKAEHSQYAGLELGLNFDTRNNGPFSTRGGQLRVLGGVNAPRTRGDAYYRHYGAEVQGFVPLDRSGRTLALRVFAEGIETDGPDRLPYDEQSRLGGKRGLRGYHRDRFTDLRQLLLTAEYRYPVSQWLLGRFFTEWGTVASEWESLRLADTAPIVGLGLMFGRPDKRSSLQVAYGEEGWHLYFGGEAVFRLISRRLR